MKTKEEIAKLSEVYSAEHMQIAFRKGYTQYQEDMTNKKPVTKEIVDYAMKITSKDVRAPKCVRDGIVKRMYTEEDVRNAFNAGDAWGRADYVGNNQPFPDEDEYINSLNKQD